MSGGSSAKGSSSFSLSMMFSVDSMEKIMSGIRSGNVVAAVVVIIVVVVGTGATVVVIVMLLALAVDDILSFF